MMAMQVYNSVPRTSLTQHSVPQGIMSNHATVVCVACDYARVMNRRKRSVSIRFRVHASWDAAAAGAAVVEVGRVTEVTKDTFWPMVNAAGDKTVVLDMYTQWCGPCKVMAPKFQKLSEKYDDVVFLKLDCNHENRPLSKELGIRVVPTFKILKDSKIVEEVTGAKLDDLVVAIENARLA